MVGKHTHDFPNTALVLSLRKPNCNRPQRLTCFKNLKQKIRKSASPWEFASDADTASSPFKKATPDQDLYTIMSSHFNGPGIKRNS